MVLQSVSLLQKSTHSIPAYYIFRLRRRVEFPSLFNHLAECVIELLARITVNGVSRRCNYLQCPPLFIAVRCLRAMKTRLLLLFASLKVNGVIHDAQSSFYHVALSALDADCFLLSLRVWCAICAELSLKGNGDRRRSMYFGRTNYKLTSSACIRYFGI